MSKDASNVVLFVVLSVMAVVALVSWLRYQHYKIDQRYLLPPRVTAHVIDQPSGEYVKVMHDSQRVYDWEEHG